MNKIQTYFLHAFGYSAVGCLICICVFLPICKLIANFLGCDYAVIALGFYLIIFAMIGYVLQSVKTDINTDTYYKNNFTPAKAIMLAIILMFFHVCLISVTTQLDEEGKILNLYSSILAEKSENNNIKELKNETNVQAKKNNDFGSDSDTDRMRYRD